jgi:hypothetical protein
MTAPTTAVRISESPEQAPVVQSVPSAECDVCPHPIDQHDAIGRRFCRATFEQAFTRNCICGSA